MTFDEWVNAEVVNIYGYTRIPIEFRELLLRCWKASIARLKGPIEISSYSYSVELRETNDRDGVTIFKDRIGANWTINLHKDEATRLGVSEMTFHWTDPVYGSYPSETGPKQLPPWGNWS